MTFFVNACCIFFAFAAGYYKNTTLFAFAALLFWGFDYAVKLKRKRKEMMHAAEAGAAPSGEADAHTTSHTIKK